MALFYPPTIPFFELRELALGIVERVVEDVGDRIDFPDSGGEAARELAVPRLPDADEVEVQEAAIRLAAVGADREAEFTASAAEGSRGVVVRLPRAAYLRKIEISYTAPPVPPPGQNVHVVIRGAGDSPPLFAHPSFSRPGDMFPRALSGLSVRSVAGGRSLLEIEGLLGTSWLIQVATAPGGSDPTGLAPLAIAPAVHRVVVGAAPSNLRVIMQTTEGDVPLWANPGMLLPDAGAQQIEFLALAQRQLGALLKTSPAGAVTLPVSLRFAADSGGAIGVSSTRLTARYKVRPLGADATTAPLGGDWTPLTLRAPAGVPPEAGAADLSVRLAGRELNAGSAPPPVASPTGGLVVDVDRMAAAAMRFLPLPGRPAGSVLPLAAVRCFLAALEPSEAVLEIRNDLSGAPGTPVTGSLPLLLDPGAPRWCEVVLPTPLPVSAGQAPLWVSLRANRGKVLWFATGEAWDAGPLAQRVSVDAGGTWAGADQPLVAGGRLLVQLYHALPDPLPPPVVRLQRGATVLADDLLAGATRRGPREFSVSGRALPAGVLAAVGATTDTGGGKAETVVRLYSPSVGDVVLQNVALFYDPFRAASRALA
jgi:hypothetical protein